MILRSLVNLPTTVTFIRTLLDMWSIDELQNVWRLAAQLHKGQQYASHIENEQVEYLSHIGSVTFEILNAINRSKSLEIEADLAIKCAVLHDTIEDTSISYEEVESLFGGVVASGVSALTKDDTLLEKEDMIRASLARIKQQPKAIWAVKMADRICNLSPPPYHWSIEKRLAYQQEARLIHKELSLGNQYLAGRLKHKIEAYSKYIVALDS